MAALADRALHVERRAGAYRPRRLAANPNPNPNPNQVRASPRAALSTSPVLQLPTYNTTYYLLLTTYYLLLTTYYVLLTTYDLRLTTYYLRLTTYDLILYLLPVTYYLLLTTCYLLPATYYLLLTTHYEPSLRSPRPTAHLHARRPAAPPSAPSPQAQRLSSSLMTGETRLVLGTARDRSAASVVGIRTPTPTLTLTLP